MACKQMPVQFLYECLQRLGVSSQMSRWLFHILVPATTKFRVPRLVFVSVTARHSRPEMSSAGSWHHRYTVNNQIYPVWVPGLRIDPLCLLAGCRNRRLNHAPINLCGLIWLLMVDWSERGNIRKRGPSSKPFRKNSALCSWQANQSWFKERRNP